MTGTKENVGRLRPFSLLPDISILSTPQSFSDTRTYPPIAREGGRTWPTSGVRSLAEGEGGYLDVSKCAEMKGRTTVFRLPEFS